MCALHNTEIQGTCKKIDARISNQAQNSSFVEKAALKNIIFRMFKTIYARTSDVKFKKNQTIEQSMPEGIQKRERSVITESSTSFFVFFSSTPWPIIYFSCSLRLTKEMPLDISDISLKALASVCNFVSIKRILQFRQVIVSFSGSFLPIKKSIVEI